ncbi:MAG: response regulator [Patescibacteria group bacterium]|nr:response regulator [Patescibacteria group bacterium]
MKHILVCEDDESILEVLKIILEDQGYRVTAWSYCNDFETIRNARPDLLLVDLWFQELGGATICSLVKSDPELSTTPVIIVSASNDLAAVAEGVHADGHISKPFNIQDIVDTVKKLV